MTMYELRKMLMDNPAELEYMYQGTERLVQECIDEPDIITNFLESDAEVSNVLVDFSKRKLYVNVVKWGDDQ